LKNKIFSEEKIQSSNQSIGNRCKIVWLNLIYY